METGAWGIVQCRREAQAASCGASQDGACLMFVAQLATRYAARPPPSQRDLHSQRTEDAHSANSWLGGAGGADGGADCGGLAGGEALLRFQQPKQ